MITDINHELEIFVVSDFTGETAGSVARAAIRQFESRKIKLTRFRYINDMERTRSVLEEARAQNAVIICTLVDHMVRERFVREAQDSGIPVIDIFGPILEMLSKRLETQPLEKPGLSHQMDEAYFKRVKSMEFSITCDDGSNPHLLPEAELVIVGVSRTCKTPLSIYLANKGIMTANVPLVPELSPPEELFQILPSRIVGLTLTAEKLAEIRRDRLILMGLDPDKASYAQLERIEKELSYAEGIMKRVGAQIVDVTGRAIEETAQEIFDYMRENHKDMF